jgi:hypothetical protein
MTERQARDDATPGEDPRQLDAERTDDTALETLARQDGITDPQPRSGGLGASTDRPGRDLADAPEPGGGAPDPGTSLDPAEPLPDPEFGMRGDADDGT